MTQHSGFSAAPGRSGGPRSSRYYCLAPILLLMANSMHGQATVPSPATPARAALDVAGDLRNRTTLRDWRRRFPGDSIEWNTSHEDEAFNDQWCAMVRGAPQRGREGVVRVAYFYVPAAPPTLALPVESPTLRESCQLGAVSLDGVSTDSLSAVRSWRSDSSRLTAALGPVTSIHGVYWPLDGSASPPMIWKYGGVSVGAVVGIHREGSARSYFPLIVMTTPVSGFDVSSEDLDRQLMDSVFVPPAGHPSIDSLIVLAGLRGAESLTIARHARLVSIEGDVKVTVDSVRDMRFAETMRALVRPESPVSPDHRIGRLLVAEWLLDAGAGRIVFWASDTIAQRLLTGLGPTFHESHMDGWWQDHFWLREALAIGGNGPAANVAFLNAMSRGFEYASDCGRGYQVDDVIERGVAYLSSHRASPIRGEVELMLAEGYRDAVLLASGGGYDAGGPDSHFAPHRDRYRRAAIAHFRNAFRLLGSAPRARADWQEAWRLIAGIGVMQASFYCVDD